MASSANSKCPPCLQGCNSITVHEKNSLVICETILLPLQEHKQACRLRKETFARFELPQQRVLCGHLTLYTACLGDVINPTASFPCSIKAPIFNLYIYCSWSFAQGLDSDHEGEKKSFFFAFLCFTSGSLTEHLEIRQNISLDGWSWLRLWNSLVTLPAPPPCVSYCCPQSLLHYPWWNMAIFPPISSNIVCRLKLYWSVVSTDCCKSTIVKTC